VYLAQGDGDTTNCNVARERDFAHIEQSTISDEVARYLIAGQGRNDIGCDGIEVSPESECRLRTRQRLGVEGDEIGFDQARRIRRLQSCKRCCIY
jgi:hypothetical protein